MKNQSRQLFRLGTLLAGLLCAASLSAATLVLTTTDPTPGADDVYNFSGGVGDNFNVSGGVDDATYVAYDQRMQGQIFTTGGSSGGYLLSDIWIRHCGYTNTAPGNGTWWNLTSGAVYTIRVTDPSKVNQAGFALSTETYTANGLENAGAQWTGGGTLGDSVWLHFTLATPVSLAASTQYGIDLTASGNGSGNFFEWFGTSNNVYSGGVAYSAASAGHTPSNTLRTNRGDRVFLVQLGHQVPRVSPTLTSPLSYVPVGQSVQVTVSFPSIANQGRSVTLVLTNNNPSLISILPGGTNKLTLNFAADATNVQTFNVQVLTDGVGNISVVTNAYFTDASIFIGTPIVAEEEFQYDSSVQPLLDGANGGSGFGAAWSQTTAFDAIVAGLTYRTNPSLVTSSNAAYVAGNGNEAFRALLGTYGGVGGGTVYVSFLAQASDGLFDWAGFSFWSGTTSENLFMGEVVASSPNNTWGFSQGGNYNMNFTGSVTPGAQVDFLVYRIDFPATNGGNALVSIYVNPPLNNTEPYSATGSAYVDNFTFDHIRLGTGDALTFDEIRIGSHWTNVVPFVGTPDPPVPPTPTLSAAARLAPVGYAASVTVWMPTNSPRPVTMVITNDNPTSFSLSSTNPAETTLTFSSGGTNVQTLNVQVLGGGSATLTVVSSPTVNTATIIIGAQVSASESFRYEAGLGLLSGSAGGVGFDVNTWTGGGDLISPGLNYLGLSSSSNAASLTATTADRILFPISGGYGGAGGGTVWISFLVRGPVPSDVANGAGLSLLNGTTEGLLLGLTTYAGGSTWGWVGPGMGPVNPPNSVVPSTNTDLLVYRLDFPAAVNDLVNITLYANPAAGPTPPAATDSGSVHYFTFNAIRISSSVTNDFDEIRLGGSWADVVPALVLNIQAVSATQVRIAWPATLTGVELQSSTNLTSGWGPAGLSVSTVNGQSVATDTITGSAKFYRLHQQ